MTRLSYHDGLLIAEGRRCPAGRRVERRGSQPGVSAATLRRHIQITAYTAGTHTRRGMKVGSTFCATLDLDRLTWLAGGLQFRAQVVPHQAPFKTSNVGQFGPGCVCACPYQGASRGCWPTNGAIAISMSASAPVPNSAYSPMRTRAGGVSLAAGPLFPALCGHPIDTRRRTRGDCGLVQSWRVGRTFCGSSGVRALLILRVENGEAA